MTLDVATPGAHLVILDEVSIQGALVVVPIGKEVGAEAEVEVEPSVVVVAVVIAAGALGLF